MEMAMPTSNANMVRTKRRHLENRAVGKSINVTRTRSTAVAVPCRLNKTMANFTLQEEDNTIIPENYMKEKEVSQSLKLQKIMLR